MCTTSVAARDLAFKLIDEYKRRKEKAERKQSNLPGSWNPQKKKVGNEEVATDGPSRVVTQIDYQKHERTVEELVAQEKEERIAQKRLQEQNRPPVGGCSHDHQKEWAIYEKSTSEKINAADRFRQDGNEAYKKQNFGLAAVHYRKALLQFDYTFAETAEEEQMLEDVKLPCLLNLAACKWQQNEWDEVLTNCRLALEINPRSVKAYYRTGMAHLARDNFDLAKDALLSAYEVEPSNPEVRDALKQLKKKIANYKVRTKDVSLTMVGGNEMAATPVPTSLDADSANHEQSGGGEDVELATTTSLQPPVPSEIPTQPTESATEVRQGQRIADPSRHPQRPERAEDEMATTSLQPVVCAEKPTQPTESAMELRQRRRDVDSSRQPQHPERNEDAEPDALPIDPKQLRILLFAAICLACVAAMSAFVVFLYPTDGDLS